MKLLEISETFFPAIKFKGQELTDRQIAVLELLGHGYSNQEMSDCLNISIRTIESHLAKIRVLIAKGSKDDEKISDRRMVLFARDLIDGYKAYQELSATSFQVQRCQVDLKHLQ